MRITETGADLIAAERRRQVEVEGYTAEHDGHQDPSSLAFAAATYALPAPARAASPGDARVPATWPWARHYWKPTPDDRTRELVKAGALIAAEIDRLLSAESEAVR